MDNDHTAAAQDVRVLCSAVGIDNQTATDTLKACQIDPLRPIGRSLFGRLVRSAPLSSPLRH